MNISVDAEKYVSRTGGVSTSPSGKDGWKVGLFLLPILIQFVAAAVQDFSLVDADALTLVQLASIAIYVVLGFGGLYFSVLHLMKFQWRKFLSYLMMLAVIWVNFNHQQFSGSNVSHYAYFLYKKASFDKAIEIAQQSKGPKIQWFFWKDISPMFGQILVYIVYDESDEFAKSHEARSIDWSIRANQSYLDAFGYSADLRMPDRAEHLLGHYYVVVLSW